MGTVTGTAILLQAAELAEDPDNEVWTPAQGLAWLNEAVRAICSQRPDACASTEVMTLTPGKSLQSLAPGRRLLRVTCNMGSDGATPGKALRFVDMDTLDASNPDWRAETPSATVYEYTYDPRDPQVFYVSPPAHASTAVKVETIQSVTPDALADASEAIPIDDTYQPALLDWVMFRYYARDSEETPNWARAGRHYAAFFQLLGIKARGDWAFSPGSIPPAVTTMSQ